MKRNGHFYCSTAPPPQAGAGWLWARACWWPLGCGQCWAVQRRGCSAEGLSFRHRQRHRQAQPRDQTARHAGAQEPGRDSAPGLIITVVILLTLFVTCCTPYIAPLKLSHVIFKASQRNWYLPLKDKLSLEMLTK